MISFAVTTHNEGTYIQQLLDQIIPYCENTGDEIVVLDDNSTDSFTLQTLYSYSDQDRIKLFNHALDNDFAEHKNYLNSLCTGDYIFQIDADETLHTHLLTYLHDIVYNNTQVDMFLIPRINIVNGLTAEDIANWHWNVTDNGWAQWPDFQTRLYRNSEHIKWENKVHERIVGYKVHAPLPAEEEWAIYHTKDISRQREQNSFYQTINK